MALARSLAPRPELLLLDEPLSALDRGLREATRTELVRVQRQLGTTFVLVTHDQEEALSMATRIGLLEKGRLAQVGTPTEIYERPVSRSVAAFMGAANILPATVRGPGLLDLTSLGVVAQTETNGRSGNLHLACAPSVCACTRGPAAGAERGGGAGGGERVSRHRGRSPGERGAGGRAAGQPTAR